MGTRHTEISKDQLLVDYIAVKTLLHKYWVFLEELPLHVFSDSEAIVSNLKQQHQALAGTKLSFQTLDMVESLMRAVLPKVHKDSLDFEFEESDAEHFDPITAFSHSIQDVEQQVDALVGSLMYLPSEFPDDTASKLKELLQNIHTLFKSIIRKDGESIRIQLSQIGLITASSSGVSALLKEVGGITREVYNSLQDLSSSIDPHPKSDSSDTMDASEIKTVKDEVPDAVQKLYSVIERLEEAANSNLESLEGLLDKSAQSMEILETSLAGIQQIEDEIKALTEKHGDLAESFGPIQTLLEEQVKQNILSLQTAIQENENTYITIMTNQGFQDLTGQTLKKIIDFMEKLELKLVDVIQKFGALEGVDGETSAIAPRVDYGVENEKVELHGPDESENQKSSQSDVDALLADMGF